jgi:hypothetical protein
MLRPTVPSSSPSWSKAPIWGLRPDLYYFWTVAGLLMWGALSDERTSLSLLSIIVVFSLYNLRLVHSTKKDICCPAMDICGPHRKHLLQHRFHCCIYSAVAYQRNLSDCCLRIHCPGNVFTESLPRNGSTRHNIVIFL